MSRNWIFWCWTQRICKHYINFSIINYINILNNLRNVKTINNMEYYNLWYLPFFVAEELCAYCKIVNLDHNWIVIHRKLRIEEKHQQKWQELIFLLEIFLYPSLPMMSPYEECQLCFFPDSEKRYFRSKIVCCNFFLYMEIKIQNYFVIFVTFIGNNISIIFWEWLWKVLNWKQS